MKINADFEARAAVHATADWAKSPMPGVERRMLDRIGEEVARATTIVRFAEGSSFSPHTHGGGEEYIVLEGVFQDETGDFPKGSYVRNPPTSRHTPASAPGCTIFVKLWQMDPEDRHSMSIDTNQVTLGPVPGRAGVRACTLFADALETVRLESWDPSSTISLPLPGGIEVLLLEGGFEEGGEAFSEQSWLRLPAGSLLNVQTGSEGARVWVKEGHLATPPRTPDTTNS